MKLAALTASLLLAIALGGCDKHQAQAKAKPAAATQAQTPMKPVKVMEPAPAATATSKEEGTCGGEAKGESCEGGCDQWDEAAAEVAKRPIPTDAEWNTIAVSGMTCGGCERRITASLGKVDGVLAVEADAELGQVRIAMAKGQDVRKVAVDQINSLGYTAK
jgi:copper chaperone